MYIYDPSCWECQEGISVFIKFADFLKENKTDLTMARVNAKENPEFSKDYKIKEFPTILFIGRDRKVLEYKYEVTEYNLLKFTNKKVWDEVLKFETMLEVNNTVNDIKKQINDINENIKNTDLKINTLNEDIQNIDIEIENVPGQSYIIDGEKKGEMFNNDDTNHNIASGNYSHAEGFGTDASGRNSHAEGNQTKATKQDSHAEGSGTSASNEGAHAEGTGTTASGINAHAEGFVTYAEGYYSHAEGSGTIALGYCSHVEGYSSIASGYYSHAEGFNTTASGYCSHAEGYETTASGYCSHSSGFKTCADKDYMTAIGMWNKYGDDYLLFAVGNGSNNARSNAFTVDKSGNATIQNNLTVNNPVIVNNSINKHPNAQTSDFCVTTSPFITSGGYQ